MKTLSKKASHPASRWRTGLLIFGLLLSCLTACKKEIDPLPEDPATPTRPTPNDPVVDPAGKVYPVGQPTDEPGVSALIGPAGGTVSSEDGRIRLEIPAGALNRPENIRIQSISNTIPTGSGPAFRLEPHGTRFAKPVTVSFTYADSDLDGTVAEALQIAYQTEKGVWMAMPHAQRNTSAKTVTIQTTHFSDWSLFSSISLYPLRQALRPGQSSLMTALSVVPYSRDLPPLVDFVDEVPLVEVHENGAVKVIRWQAIGAGRIQASGTSINQATYVAPAAVDKPTPATVTAQIQGKGNQLLLLVANIMIMQEGVMIRIDKGPWIHLVGSAQQITQNGQGIVINGAGTPEKGKPAYRLNITTLPFAGSLGVYLGWSRAAFNLLIGESDKQYTNFYAPNGDPSPGRLWISSLRYSNSPNPVMKPIDVSGDFFLEKAQLYHLQEDYPLKGTHHIEGYYLIGTPVLP